MSILSKPWRVSLQLSANLCLFSQLVQTRRRLHGGCVHTSIRNRRGAAAAACARPGLSGYNSPSPLQGTQPFKSSLVMKQH